jgi:hypothetical protein
MSSDKKETVCSDIDVYSVLEHRARFVRRTNIALIILLIMAATLVTTLIVGYKDNQKNWISDILNASIIKKITSSRAIWFYLILVKMRGIGMWVYF